MATSEAQICNKALAKIGQTKFISALTDSSQAGQACAVLYPSARDELLEAVNWPFARRTATLAQLADSYERTPWAYAYSLPADCLVVRAIWSGKRNPRSDERIPFEVMSNDDLSARILFTDELDAELLYTAKMTTVPTFSALFIDALAWRLAAELSMALSIKESVAAKAEKMAAYALKVAMAAAAAEVQLDVEPESIFLAERG